MSITIDKNRHYVVADQKGEPPFKNTLARITAVYGSVEVSVDTTGYSHHSTIRKDARALLRETLGSGWEIVSYLGPEYYRREDGHNVKGARFLAVEMTYTV